MKNAIGLTFALILAFSLSACSGKSATSTPSSSGGNNKSTPTSTSKPTASESAEPDTDTPNELDKSEEMTGNKYWLSNMVTDEELEYNKDATTAEDFVFVEDGWSSDLVITRAYDIAYYNDAKEVTLLAVARYNGKATSVKIPSYYIAPKGKFGMDFDIGYVDESKNEIGGDFRRIDEILLEVFSDNLTITSVTLPNSITRIGARAFKGCINLTDINIPDSLLFVESKVLDNTAWYDSQPEGLVYLGKGILGSKGEYTSSVLELPSGVTFIANTAFVSNKNITKLILPKSCLVLNTGSFADCTALTNIDLGGIRTLDARVFEDCISLETVSIPDSCQYIDDRAFEGCTALTKAYIPESVAYISGWGGTGKKNMDSHPFRNCDNLTLYIYENSVAHDYAKDTGIPFKLVDSAPDWAK
jgi:hypothetical protein